MLMLCLILSHFLALTLAIDPSCGDITNPITTTPASLNLAPYNETALQFFDDIDENGDFSINQTEIDDLYADFDKDKNGTITREEFQVSVDCHWPEFRGYENEVFCYFDVDHNGFLNEIDFIKLLELTDPNNDTIITKDEFLSVFPVLLQGLEILENLSDMFHGHGHDDDECPIQL